MNNDWRYSDDRMVLRAEAFIKLRKKHFNLRNSKHMYEFCHTWVSQGNPTTEGIEQAFEQYLDDIRST